MSKDVIISVTLESAQNTMDSLDILMISTEGEKDTKTYTSLEDIKADWTESSTMYKKAAALFNQGKARPTPASLIRKVTIVGMEKPESAAAFVTAIKEYQKTNNDWYIFLTDQTDKEYLAALGAFAEDSEPSEAELTAGVEDHRKLFIAQTTDKEYSSKTARTIIIYTDNADEHADAAWLGAVGPWYPESVTWKFKLPSGISVPALSESEITALEENHVNFVTDEYKQNYIKNGTCMDGEWIDAVIGKDWITRAIRENIYAIFINNKKISYTDTGFLLVAAGVFDALDAATGYHIVAEEKESGAGVYNVTVPKRSQATDEQAEKRQMPDIEWEAQLDGAVHGVKVRGVLKVTLN